MAEQGGYADQIKTLALPTGRRERLPRSDDGTERPELTLADAAAGGTLTGKRRRSDLVFAAGSIVDACRRAGERPRAGRRWTPIDVAHRRARSFPAASRACARTAPSALILSYGTVEFALSAAAGRCRLAPGRSATIEISLVRRQACRRQPDQGRGHH
jgi:hypothetical protein